MYLQPIQLEVKLNSSLIERWLYLLLLTISLKK
nr:MAG TPA: hypothetical protein [Caudoviricetes sp.]DAP66408.1 MAG TPA: hypothetical protein [Caudoviricetes sp.]